MNILNYILSLFVIGLINIKDSSPISQNIAQHTYKSIKYICYSDLSYIRKSSNSNFDLTDFTDGCLEFDQDDNDNSNHIKNLFIRILNSGESKIFPLREKEFIPKKSSSYFELDLPPPIIS